MTFIADILLFSGAAGAAFYCFVLSRRLTRFTDLEKGVGGAVAVLSVQVDDLTKALEAAQRSGAEAATRLEKTTRRAEDAASRLELLMAASQDRPDPARGGAAPRTGRAVRRNRRSDPAIQAEEEA